jgi:hypothetical protein
MVINAPNPTHNFFMMIPFYGAFISIVATCFWIWLLLFGKDNAQLADHQAPYFSRAREADI